MKTRTATFASAGLALAVLLASAPAPASAAEVVEEIVARVNDTIITKSMYERRETAMLRELASNLQGEELVKAQRQARQTLLRDMINEMLVVERAAELGIDVSSPEVDDAVARVKRQYGLRDDEAFKAALASNGVTLEELRERLRTTVLTNKVLMREVQSKVTITEEEERQRYEKEKERWAVPEKAELREVLIPYDGDAARAQALKTAAEVKRGIASGADFATLSKQYSKAENAAEGGDMGVFARGELAAPLDTAVWALADGAASEPIDHRGAIHVIQRVKTIPAGARPFAEVKEDLEAQMFDEAMRTKLDQYLLKLRGDLYVKVYDTSVTQLAQ